MRGQWREGWWWGCFCFKPMECCYWLVGWLVSWLVGGDESEKRDPDSYMIPEDGVAEVCEVGSGVLPMMYPCDLISRPWVPNVEHAAEIQQRWLAWRPPCSNFWGRWTGAAVTPLGSCPLTSGIQTPFDQTGVPESAPGAASRTSWFFPPCLACHWRESLQRLWNGLTDVVLLHAVCTRLTLLTGPAEFSFVRIKCVVTHERLRVDAPKFYAALPVQPHGPIGLTQQ